MIFKMLFLFVLILPTVNHCTGENLQLAVSVMLYLPLVESARESLFMIIKYFFLSGIKATTLCSACYRLYYAQMVYFYWCVVSNWYCDNHCSTTHFNYYVSTTHGHTMRSIKYYTSEPHSQVHNPWPYDAEYKILYE